MESELTENQSWAAKIFIVDTEKISESKLSNILTNPPMLIILCLNNYLANYLRIDIPCLSAQSREHEIIL